MVAWGATHDYNQSGIPEKKLDQLIDSCEKKGLKIILSTIFFCDRYSSKSLKKFPIGPCSSNIFLYFKSLNFLFILFFLYFGYVCLD